MRYSLLSFLNLRSKLVIFQPDAYNRVTYDKEFIESIQINNYLELSNGIIIGKSKISRFQFNEPIVFIPESHYLFNLPMIDNKIDYQFTNFGPDANIPAMSLSLQFTTLIQTEIGDDNFDNLTNHLKFDV